jgi:putative oxygen-independent coproporphyrinogen III oxidase
MQPAENRTPPRSHEPQTDLPPLALYVHLPWCVRKCPYCDFNSHELRGALPAAEYLRALLADFEQDIAQTSGRRLESVFFGGGTPSLFAPADLAALLDAVHARVPCADTLEVTMEANPGAVEHGRFRDYRAAGINRLSLGVQSFDTRNLAALGRIHDAEAAHVAIAQAQAAGFDNLNIDLMYGLPGQSPREALLDVRTACASAPAHISHYQLTLEPGTPFHRQPPVLPDEDACATIQEAAQACLHDAGYAQYEVSAYAQPARQCVHNLNYWHYGDYLGIGAGAHAKVTTAAGVRRTSKRRQPSAYVAQAQGPGRIEGEREIGPREAAFEYMLNALRLCNGFSRDELEERSRCAVEAIAPALAEATARGLLRPTASGWQPTALGSRFLNDLQALFLP